MKRHCLLLPFVTLLLCPSILHADEKDRKNPPEGMEIIKVGGAESIVPIGARMYKKGDLNVVEDIAEFSSRKFVQIQNQFENIETKHDRLANETKEDLKRLHSKQEEIEKTLILKKDAMEFKRDFTDIQKQFNNIETLRNNLENKIQIKQEEIEKTLKHIMNEMQEISKHTTENKKIVEKYIDGFNKSDYVQILSCLTEDIEWEMPGAFHLVGKDAFDKEIENNAFVGSRTISIARMIEEEDVVIAEGSVRVERKEGGFLNAVFCDVFVMEKGKIKRLTSYLSEVKN